MRKLILLFYFLGAGIACLAQQNKIAYIIPDSVEMAIDKHLTTLKKSKNEYFMFFYLGRAAANQYRLYLIKDEKKSKVDTADFLHKAAMSTNRFLLINQTKYPLIFDYDFMFGTPCEEDIGSFGSREGNVVRMNPLFHGYSILFNAWGNVIKESYP